VLVFLFFDEPSTACSVNSIFITKEGLTVKVKRMYYFITNNNNNIIIMKRMILGV
jgi:hypothetical protein